MPHGADTANSWPQFTIHLLRSSVTDLNSLWPRWTRPSMNWRTSKSRVSQQLNCSRKTQTRWLTTMARELWTPWHRSWRATERLVVKRSRRRTMRMRMRRRRLKMSRRSCKLLFGRPLFVALIYVSSVWLAILMLFLFFTKINKTAVTVIL